MAVKTYRLTGGNDGNFGAIQEADVAAASRADGWTVAKLAAAQSADWARGLKQASSAFSANGTTPKPTALITTLNSQALKTPAALSGVFAATAWTLTFALRASVVSAQAGRIRMRVYRSVNADGTGATEITSATQIGTTSAVLSTSADVTSTVTWSPGALTLNAEYLFFTLAWEVTTAGGSNTADVLLRTGQAAAGTRIVTPDFTVGATRWYGAVARATSFGKDVAGYSWALTKLATLKERFAPIVNLPPNPGFEVDASGWDAISIHLPASATLVRTTAEKHSGVASGQMTGAVLYAGRATAFATTPSRYYDASVWVKTSVDQVVAFYISRDDGGDPTGTEWSLKAGIWSKLSTIYYANSAGAHALVRAVSPLPATFYIDDLVVHETGIGELQMGPLGGWNGSGAFVPGSGVGSIPTNLLQNPMFENDPIGIAPSWWGAAAEITVTTVASPDGSGSKVARSERTAPYAGDANSLFQGVPNLPGPGDYIARAWVWVPSTFRGPDLFLTVASRVSGADERANLSLRDQWQKITARFWADGAQTVYPVFYAPNNSVGDFFYVDNVEVGADSAAPYWDAATERAVLPSISGGGATSVETEGKRNAQWYHPQVVFDMRDSSLSARVVIPPAPPSGVVEIDVYVKAADGSGNLLDFGADSSGQLYAYTKLSGTWAQVGTSGVYDPVAHAYLRIRETSGTIFFETSPNAQDWTTFRSVATPFNVARVTPAFENYQGGTGATTPGYIDDVNIVKWYGAVARATTFGSTTAGRIPAKTAYGVVARATTFTSTTQAKRTTFGAVARASVFAAVTQAKRKTFAAIAQATTFDAVTQAVRKAFGVVARPTVFTATTQGQKSTPVITHYGVVARPTTFAATTQGRARKVGEVGIAATFGAVTQGRKQTFSSIVSPWLFGAVTQGRRNVRSSSSASFTFAAATQAQRKTFGQIARGSTIAIVTQGQRIQLGVIARTTTFAAVTQARRQTFTVLARPISFSSTTQARRTTFAHVVMPLETTIEVGRPRLTASARLALVLEMQIDTYGIVKLTNVAVVNYADAIYLGSEEADAVYAGDVLVWH